MLFAKEDGRACFLVGGVLDIGAPITVSVVYIRAGVSPLPHYVAKLWANGPPGEPKGTTDAVEVEMEVTSSKDPGDIDMQKLTFLTVPPKLLAGLSWCPSTLRLTSSHPKCFYSDFCLSL